MLQKQRLKIVTVKKQINQAIECVNVTVMETSQRRLALTDGLNKNGFRGFIKHQQSNQTYYIFLYESQNNG